MALFGLLSTREFNAGLTKLKEEILMGLKDQVLELKGAVDALRERVALLVGPLQDANATLKAALEEERRIAAELAAAEDEEDVEQNAALAEAKAATDEALRINEEAATQIALLKDDVDNTLPEPVDEPTPEEPAAAE